MDRGSLVSIPANPVPEGAVSGRINTCDGVGLRFAHWQDSLKRRGTICLFPGRGEFIEKYFETVRDLRIRGFAVAALDWRGQGFSDRLLPDPRKGHVHDFDEYEVDVETFLEAVVLPNLPSPLIALGHSMGGAIVLRVGHKHPEWFDRIILSTPMVKFARREGSTISRLTIAAMRMVGLGRSYVPYGGPTIPASLPFEGNPVTSDPIRYARTKAVVDSVPELGIGAPTVAWLHAAHRTIRKFRDPDYLAEVSQPVLLISAGRDQLVGPEDISNVAARLRAGSYFRIEDARHEPMMERDHLRNQFLHALDAFVL